jgi:hypothetical protein
MYLIGSTEDDYAGKVNGSGTRVELHQVITAAGKWKGLYDSIQ